MRLKLIDSLANFSVFNIAKKKIGWETLWDSVKFTWDSSFVDALGPRDAIEIKPKSNTDRERNQSKFAE